MQDWLLSKMKYSINGNYEKKIIEEIKKSWQNQSEIWK